MKTTLRTIVAGAVLSAAVALSPATSTAFMGDDGPLPPDGGGIRKLSKELQLTPQQQQQFRDIFARNRPQGEPLRKQFLDERRALRALIQAETVDEPAIRAQVAKLAAVEADMAVHRAHVSKEIRAILTPEQIAKTKELQEQRDKMMEERPAKAGRRLRQGQQ